MSVNFFLRHPLLSHINWIFAFYCSGKMLLLMYHINLLIPKSSLLWGNFATSAKDIWSVSSLWIFMRWFNLAWLMEFLKYRTRGTIVRSRIISRTPKKQANFHFFVLKFPHKKRKKQIETADNRAARTVPKFIDFRFIQWTLYWWILLLIFNWLF